MLWGVWRHPIFTQGKKIIKKGRVGLIREKAGGGGTPYVAIGILIRQKGGGGA